MWRHLGSTEQLHLGYQTCQAVPCLAAGRGDVEPSWREGPECGTVQRVSHGEDEEAACGLARLEE